MKLRGPLLVKYVSDLMAPEGSLPNLQEPATFSYTASDQSNPVPHPTSLRSVLILSSHLSLGYSSGLLSSGFPTKILYAPLAASPLTRYVLRPSYAS